MLGVSNEATLGEARKAYKSLIKVFHPDLNSGTPEQARQATDATARINQAWDTLEDLDKRGLLGRFVEDAQAPGHGAPEFRLHPRQPNWAECVICGSTPAAGATFRFIQTFLLWFQSASLSGTFCRACGVEVFRDAQSRLLTRGWWGLGILALPFMAVGNLLARRAVRAQEMPSYRDFNVVTPTDQPLFPGRPVLRRPAVLLVLAVIVAAVVGVVASSALQVASSPSSSSANRASSTSPTTQSTTSSAPNSASDAPAPSTQAEVTPAEAQMLLDSVYERGIEVGYTQRQAECVVDQVAQFTPAEMTEFVSGEMGARLDARWGNILYGCGMPVVGDCVERVGVQFSVVECSDPNASLKVAKAPAFAPAGVCSGYADAMQVGSRVFCLKERK